MKTSKLILLITSLFITGPIWYYLLYKILIGVHATELMMFLYWVYVPVGILMTIISKTTEDKKDK